MGLIRPVEVVQSHSEGNMTSAMASVSPFKQSIHASGGKKNKILIQSGPFTRYRWLFGFFKTNRSKKKTKINFVSKSNSKQKLKLADGLVQYYCSVSCGSGMICSEVVMWMPQKIRGGHLTWAKCAFSAAEHWKSLEMMLKKNKRWRKHHAFLVHLVWVQE